MDNTARVVDALLGRFSSIHVARKDDTCYATQNRHDEVKELVGPRKVVLVVGSPNSSNSNRLREVAADQGVPPYPVDNAAELQQGRVASAPEEVLVAEVMTRLKEWGATQANEGAGRSEGVVFSLPQELW